MEEKMEEERKFYDNMHPRKEVVREEPQKDPRTADGKTKKKKKRTKLLIIPIILLLLAGIGAALYFTGALNPLISKYTMLLSVEAREASVAQKETELKSTAKTLERQQSELDQREADLKQQEEQLQQQQSEQMSFQEYQASLSQEDLAALKQVSGIYSKMTPKTAAAVIEQMSDQNRAAMILYGMH